MISSLNLVTTITVNKLIDHHVHIDFQCMAISSAYTSAWISLAWS
jgi:hypothetical protein